MRTDKKRCRGLILMATLLMLSCLCSCALAEAGTFFPWHTYTLDVALVSTDPEIVNVQNAPSGGAMVLVQLIPSAGTIRTDDIKNYSEEICLRDKDGVEYTAAMWRVRGVEFDTEKGLFSTKPEQDAFEMLYFLEGKTPEALVGAKLLVPTGVEGEQIIVDLDKAPHSVSTDQTSEAE